MVIIFRTCQPSKNPLRNLRARIKKFNWSSEQGSEFCQLKAELNGGNVFTKFKPNEMATLRCDASPIGAEAVLEQNNKPVLYISRTLSQTERKYDQLQREA